MVIQGELMLEQDEGETLMQMGDCAAFPAGDPNGHRLINRTGSEARFLVIGTKHPEEVAYYSDVDMMVTFANGKARFSGKDGSDLPHE
jgi:uncharacterized cupin superfamily protein